MKSCRFAVTPTESATSNEKLQIYCHTLLRLYCNDPKFLDRQIWANSVGPDQTAPEGDSDQGLICVMPSCLHFWVHYCMLKAIVQILG